MDPIDQYDADPVRVGANPTLNTAAAGIEVDLSQQPIWDQLTGKFVSWLRYHFAAATRIENPYLVDYVWTTDTETSPIQIDSLARWNPKNASQRPCILVDRLEQERDMQTRAIGDQYQGVRPGNFWFVMTGAHVVHCLGGREGEAELLNWEVYRTLSREAPAVRCKLGLLRLIAPKIGKRVQLTDVEGREHYSVPVFLSYAYEEKFRTFPLDEVEITGLLTTLGSP